MKLATVVATLTAASTLVLLWDRYHRPETRLVASIGYGPLVISPDRISDAEIIKKLRYPREVLEGAKLPYDAQARVIAELAKLIPETEPRRPEGYMRITVNNDGTQAATDVRLAIPHAMVSVVSSEGKPDKQLDGPVLELGTLPATDSLDVVAFTGSEPNWLDYDKVRLTHASGVGKKVFKEPDQPRSVWSEWMPLILLVSVPIGFLLVGATVSVWRESVLERGRAEGAAAERKKTAEKAEPSEGK
jgi:hypothetical protein